MDESLTQQRRGRDEGFLSCKPLSTGTIVTVPVEEAPANYVPAAAVIHRVQALFGFIGRKELVGGSISDVLIPQAQPGAATSNCCD